MRAGAIGTVVEDAVPHVVTVGDLDALGRETAVRRQLGLVAGHALEVGFHANDEADERVSDIVEAIASHAKMRPDVRYMPLEEARTKMGAYADALALDQIVRSPRARALGWTPTLHSVSGNVARLLEEFRAAREAA